MILFSVSVYNFVSPEAASHAQSIEELQQQIGKRDAIILDLLERVEALEARLPQAVAADQRVKQTGQPTGRSDDAPPGDEETSRALERTLVREGGLVLPPGSIEIEPRYTYTYRSSDALGLVNVNGAEIVAQQDVKHDTSDVSLNLRMGLPWTSQLDFRLPYTFDWQETVTAASERRRRRRSGWGDIELGLTKQLIQERGWIPDVLTAVNWKTKTGDSDIGTGFHEIQGALTAVKRRDPLAFFGTISHAWSLSRNDVDLGNTVGLRFGTILATSPDTSLRFSLEMNRSARTKIDSSKIPGSDTVDSLFEFGLATIVFPRTLLDLTAGIGLTSDSPDFRLGVSLPFTLY
jgi:hypothetical protein